MSKQKLLVVGNGMASLRFIEELLVVAPNQFAMTVVGEEADPAYNRVLLSPLLAGEISTDDVRTRSREWYVANGIELITGVLVKSLDVASRRAMLSNGNAVAYDKCVLATGSAAIRLNIPGNDLRGVEVFRSLADLSGLLAPAQRGADVIVIGGGLLGIEAACGLKRAGANVTLLHVMDRLMERQLDAASAWLLKVALEAKGVRVELQADTACIDGESCVEALALKNGCRLPASLVVMAVGVRPRIEIAKAAGIACGRGIRVNDAMKTSARDVFAIGECAEHRNTVCGLVEPAYEHARVAASVLAGHAETYAGIVMSTNLKVSGIPVFSAGDFEGHEAEQIVWCDQSSGAYRKFVVRDERLVGVVLMGDTADAIWYRDLIRSETTIAPFRAALPFGQAFAEAA